jgi:hypothetical protein
MNRTGARGCLGLAIAVLGVVGVLASATAGGAAASFRTGLSGPEYVSPSTPERATWLQRALDARAEIIRIGVGWSGIATARPQDPSDPADPAYDWAGVDASISDISDRGLRPLLTIGSAPGYAESGEPPPRAMPGSWKPNPKAVEGFGRAIATRYSGTFAGLPRVRYFQLWNEPNLSLYLSPSYAGRRLVSAGLYRRMLNAFYRGVKSVHPDNLVITGGTAPYGDPPGGKRVRPLIFWRSVFCLRRHGHRYGRARGCSGRAHFDVLAHHPINTAGGPTRSAVNHDDISTPDVGVLRRALRAAERLHTVAGPRHHQLWATEIWWESDPPDTVRGVPLDTHARYIEQALYLLWKQGVKVVVNLLVRDAPHDPGDPTDTVEAGLFFEDGSPKPAYEAFRFPFVAERLSRGKLRVWGKSPASGKLVIERRGEGGWEAVQSLQARAGGVFVAVLPLRGAQELRAVVGGESSLVWAVR